MSQLPVLKGYRIQLRPFAATDAAEVQRYCGAEQIGVRVGGVPHPYPAGEAERWIATHAQLWAQRDAMIYAIADRSGEKLLGAISLRLDLPNKNAKIGFWVGVQHWGEGYCTEAAGLMKRVALEHLKLHRLWGTHFSGNVPCGKVFERIGMKREGVMRGHELNNGRYEDCEVWGYVAR